MKRRPSKFSYGINDKRKKGIENCFLEKQITRVNKELSDVKRILRHMDCFQRTVSSQYDELDA